MGKYYNWKLTLHADKHMNDTKLKNHFYSLGFNYMIEVTNHFDIGGSIINHPEIIELTNNEWTGFFNNINGKYYLFFKDECDAMAAKLRWV